jgi:hypothetical protein
LSSVAKSSLVNKAAVRREGCTLAIISVAMGIPADDIEVTVERDLDLQGTLGMPKNVPVGFESITVRFDVRAPQATPEQMTAHQQKNRAVLRSDANLAASSTNEECVGKCVVVAQCRTRRRSASMAVGGGANLCLVESEAVRWQNFDDVRGMFKDADFVDGYVIFNIRHTGSQ